MSIKVTGIAKYVKDKFIRQNTPFKIKPDGSFYFHEGQEIPVNEFHKMFPMKLQPINYKGENKDGTKVR